MAAGAITATGPTGASRKPLILALVLGAVAAGLAVAFLASANSGDGKPAAGAADVSVVVATEQIPVGTKVTAGMVQVKQIPSSAAISDPFSNVNDIVGQVTRFPMNANEQFSRGRLIQAPQATSLSFSIPAGLRGFAVPVDKTTSPSELIAPGDYVDVIVTIKNVNVSTTVQSAPVISSGSNNDFKGAVTLIQNVQVLSVQKNFVDNGVPYDPTVRGKPDDKTDGNYVTLAVNPDQAQLLALASQEGHITLSLRAFGDDKTADVAPVMEPVRIK